MYVCVCVFGVCMCVHSMKARVRADSELLEEIKVTNCLRYGYTLASTVFNIYASVAVEYWLDSIKTIDNVGTLIIIRQDTLLF